MKSAGAPVGARIFWCRKRGSEPHASAARLLTEFALRANSRGHRKQQNFFLFLRRGGFSPSRPQKRRAPLWAPAFFGAGSGGLNHTQARRACSPSLPCGQTHAATENSKISFSFFAAAGSPRRVRKKGGRPCGRPPFLVPEAGVEPARYRYHGILSPARLPIPSFRQATRLL